MQTVARVPVCRCVDDLISEVKRTEGRHEATVIAFLSRSDFSFKITYTDFGATVSTRVTFREESPSGGTWWTTVSHDVHETEPDLVVERVTATLLADITALQDRFERLLQEATQRFPE